MGYRVIADADYSMAVGRIASTNGHTGAFVSGDASINDSIQASANNQFGVRARGGFRFRTSTATGDNVGVNGNTGCDLPGNSGSMTCASSRTLEKRQGSQDYVVQYRLACPHLHMGGVDCLVRRAIAYGVNPAVAEGLAATKWTQLAAVLAAATIGMITPRRDFASMIGHYVKQDRNVIDGHRDGPADVPTVSTRSADAYIQHTAMFRANMISWEGPIVVERAAARTSELLDELLLTAEPWAAQGIRALVLDDMLGTPSLLEYTRAGSGERPAAGRAPRRSEPRYLPGD